MPLTPRTNKTLGEEPGGGGMGYLSLPCCQRHWCGSREGRCEGRYKDRGLTSWRLHHIWPGLLREGPGAGAEPGLGLARWGTLLWAQGLGDSSYRVPRSPEGIVTTEVWGKARTHSEKKQHRLMSAFLNQRLVWCLDLFNLMPPVLGTQCPFKPRPIL